MIEKHLRIGLKLRHARKVKGYLLSDLSKKVGCSEGFLSKLENDKVRPSLQLLHKIVKQLGTSIGALFDTEGEMEGIVMRAGSRPLITMNTDGSTEGVTLECFVSNPEARLLNGAIHIVAPGSGSEGVISHVGEEIGYVLEGELDLEVDGKLYHLQPGDSFFFQSDLEHGYKNVTNKTARVLWVNTPPTF